MVCSVELFLILTSTILTFISITLIKWYMMSHLSFWHPDFAIAPYLILALGIFTFVISFYGCILVGITYNRGLLISFAVLLSITCLTQISSIFVFLNVRSRIENSM